MRITAIKDNADLLKAVRGFYEQHATALNGIMEKMPEGLRGDLKALYDSINANLKALPPLEQVPAAQEAGWAFNAFANAIVQMQEYASNLFERLSTTNKELSAKVVALHSFDEQVGKGELVTKDKLKELLDLARSEGASSRNAEVLVLRKSALELAGLPVPSEDVLGLSADQYQARFAAAQENLKKLAGKGIKPDGKGAGFAKAMAWLNATEFAGQLANLEELLPSLKETKTADPLLGAPSGEPAAEDRSGPVITLA